MESVIVVFPKTEDGTKIRSLLVRNGVEVDCVCTSGAQALERATSLESGLILCSYRLIDMTCEELWECMPKGFELLLMASPQHCAEVRQEIMKVGMPIKIFDLLNTIHMLFEMQARQRKKQRMVPKKRSEEDMNLIKEAKRVLLDRNHMTEDEAHKYLQKCSMDSGNSMLDTAKMVLCLYRD